MFKWLTEDADYKFHLESNFSLEEIVFSFELFNLKFNVNIPLPFKWYHFIDIWSKTILSPFCYKYKDLDNTHRRWWEFQLYFESNLKTGFAFFIPKALRDHNDRGLTISIFGLTFVLTSYHSWHLCICESNMIDRFPTDDECKAYNEYCDKKMNEIFGDRRPNYFNCSEEDNKLFKQYYKDIQDYYNNIPANDVIEDDD